MMVVEAYTSRNDRYQSDGISAKLTAALRPTERVGSQRNHRNSGA
jgi:hypothetical protein